MDTKFQDVLFGSLKKLSGSEVGVNTFDQGISEREIYPSIHLSLSLYVYVCRCV